MRRARCAIDGDGAARGGLEAQQRAHERGLAGAVAADQADDFALTDGEMDGAQHGLFVGAAEIGGQRLDLEPLRLLRRNRRHAALMRQERRFDADRVEGSRVPDRFAPRLIGDDLAVSQEDDAIGQAIKPGEVLFGDDDGEVFGAQLLQQDDHAAARIGIEAGGRLIEHQQGRLPDEGGGQGDTAAFATRQGADFAAEQFDQTHFLDGGGDARAHFRLRHATIFEREGDEILDRQVPGLILHRLQDDANLTEDIGGLQGAIIGALQGHGALHAPRMQQFRNDAAHGGEQRGFSASGGAGDDHRAAGFNRQIDRTDYVPVGSKADRQSFLTQHFTCPVRSDGASRG